MRRGLVPSIVLMLAGLGPAAAFHEVPVAPDVFPRVAEILSPLAGMPVIVEDGSSFRVELDPALVGDPAPADVGVNVTPSFGTTKLAYDLDLQMLELDVPSTLWPGRTVHAMTFAIPSFDDPSKGPFVEDLYDILAWAGQAVDIQHRALKVVDAIPAAPRVAIIADPSVGDPRPIQEGAEEFLDSGEADSLIDKTTKTVGNPMNEDRWAALGRAIDEINLVQPDFVLVTGDLTFGVYPRPANVEYEDAYRIISRLQVPTYLSPGNHDLYDVDYDDLERPHTSDGWELWQQYFGPLYYSVDIGPDFHLVSLNTYDWPAAEREPFDEDDEFETRAGGQVQAEQFQWLEADLAAYRDANPDGSVVTFAHHDPSWIQRRHPWAGINRLQTRDLLADAEVGAHFAGHTHEDRVARYHEGNIAETNGRSGPDRQLHYVLRDNTLGSKTQEELGAILRDPQNGPLFVTTTTVSSVLKGSDWGLGSYWGWRLGTLRRVGPGYDPIDLGYPTTETMLEELAERPGKWNPDHGQYGVFSYPSYHLDASLERDVVTGPASAATWTLASRLLVPIDLVMPFSLAASEAGDVTVSGGTLERSRSVGGITDLWVRVTLAPGGSATVSATVD